MTNIIKNELEKRITDADTLYAIVGPEIRLRRSLLNKTLKFMAYHICSISYVSKIESSAIKPNRIFLNEIGKKVDMTEKEIDGLFDLREILDNGIKDFLFNDNSRVKKALEEKSEYVNYRYRLLVLLNAINNNDLDSSNETYIQLLKISKSMTSYDFKIFALLSSIYLYKCGNIKEAYENLKLLEELELNKNIRYILELYLFYCLNSLGKPETFIYYQKTRENLICIGSYDLLDEVNYYFAIYYIKNGSANFSLTLIDTIRDIKRKKTIELLSAVLSNGPINYFKKKELLAPAKCIYDYVHDKKSLSNDIIDGTKNYYQLDFYPLIFEYLLIEDLTEKYAFINEKAIQALKKSDDLFIKKFFIKEAFKISESTAKYKILFDVYKFYNKGEYF